MRQRNFRLFWIGESVSEVGNAVTIVVIPLVAINTLHASTFVVTLLTAMVWLPWVIIGIPAGAWVDRLPPRPVMLVCNAISVAVYASIPVVGQTFDEPRRSPPDPSVLNRQQLDSYG